MLFIYLFWLRWVLVVACGIFQLRHVDFLVAACMQDLAPRPGIEPGLLALGVQSLTHWTTREVPYHHSFCQGFSPDLLVDKNLPSCSFFKKWSTLLLVSQRMDLRTWGWGRVSWDEVREWHGLMYTTKCEIDSQWETAAQHRKISSVLCDHLEGWDREGGREMQEGGDMGTYVYVQLVHFVIKQLYSNKDV